MRLNGGADCRPESDLQSKQIKVTVVLNSEPKLYFSYLEKLVGKHGRIAGAEIAT